MEPAQDREWRSLRLASISDCWRYQLHTPFHRGQSIPNTETNQKEECSRLIPIRRMQSPQRPFLNSFSNCRHRVWWHCILHVQHLQSTSLNQLINESYHRHSMGRWTVNGQNFPVNELSPTVFIQLRTPLLRLCCSATLFLPVSTPLSTALPIYYHKTNNYPKQK